MEELLRKALERIPQFQVDFADARLFESEATNIAVQDGRADKISTPNSYGVGVRALVDGSWGFAALSRITASDLDHALTDAVSLAKAAGRLATDKGKMAPAGPYVDEVINPVKTDPRDVALEDKLEMASELEKASRTHDPQKIANTMVSYTDTVTNEIVVNTQGTCIRNQSIRTHVSSFAAARDGELRQSAAERVGRREGYELAEGLDPEQFSVKAAQTAIELLSAQNAPAGRYPVILDPQVTGLFTHEALGHNAEADGVWSGESILAGKVGEQVGSELVTIYDDSTLPGAYGSYSYDSEGTPGGKRTLIEKGVVKSFMQSLETAAKLDMEPNGSARAMNHQVPPIVRMSNTYIGPGDWSLDEILAETKDGILLTRGQWGYVFVERGQFTCNAEMGWRIRDGQKAEMLRNVSAAGMTLDTLKTIDAVGNTIELRAPGMCGKAGQSMPVDNGGPYVRVKELVVGGQR